jgi:outer membrane protein assembly factor BamB
MHHSCRRIAACLVFFASASLPAQEWTRFRGPNGSGLSDAEGIPSRWTESDYDWNARLPGAGHSQPVIWGKRIFLTAAADEGRERFVVCLRVEDGGIAWKKSYRLSMHSKHQRNSFASSTPAVDEERVYFLFSAPEAGALRALDHDGKEVWSRELGPLDNKHGDGSSPIVWEDMVVLGCDQDGGSFLIAVDRKRGEPRWRVERQSEVTSYGTPCIYRDGDTTALLFTSQAHGLTGLEARTGKVLWEEKVFDKRTVSSPVLAGGLAMATCGSGGGGNYLVAVRLGATAGANGSRVAYQVKQSAPYVPTPIARGDRLFLWNDKGIVSCVEAGTGRSLWRERVEGDFSGSPICIRDRLYAISEAGEVVVVAAADRFELLGRTALGEESKSTPAVAGGRLYLRTESRLFSLGGKKVAETRPATSPPPTSSGSAPAPR